MRKIFLISSLLITTIVFAQNPVTFTSAQQAVKFIESAARTYIGKDEGSVKTSEILFTGNNFRLLRKGTSLTFMRDWQNIDWANFVRFSSTAPENGKIFVIFYFNSNSILKQRTTIDGTGATTESESEQEDNFNFYIPDSEESKLKDLEAAGKYLSQAVKTQGNIFGSLPSTGGKKPAEGKPTYQETVDFIKSHFAADFFRDGKYFEGGHAIGTSMYFEKKYKIIDLSFVDCNVKISYQVTSGTIGYPNSYSTQTINRFIDLSQVESLDLVQYGKSQYAVYGLFFKVKNKPMNEEMDLPFGRMAIRPDNFETLKNDKPYKAFNHLRKLCGAPEPISFD